MATEIVSFPIENGDCPYHVKLLEGMWNVLVYLMMMQIGKTDFMTLSKFIQHIPNKDPKNILNPSTR